MEKKTAKMVCTYCMGTGKKNSDPKKPCPYCGGSGQQTVQL